MNKCKYLLISLLISIFGMLFFIGCEREESEPLDNTILNSPELEEYIIAGADFQQSLAVFTAGLNKIDFSTLEVTYDAEGRKTVHLPPASVGSFKIEEKVNTFNGKKDALLKRFPQFASFKEGLNKEYFRQSIQSSVKIKGEFLKLGINAHPRLKNGGNENNKHYGGEDWVVLQSDLYFWINSPGYLEVWIICYADGSYATYQSPNSRYDPTNNTYYSGNISFNGSASGPWYYPSGGSSSQVTGIGHTHKDHSDATRPADFFYAPSGVNRFIYYNFGMYYY